LVTVVSAKTAKFPGLLAGLGQRARGATLEVGVAVGVVVWVGDPLAVAVAVTVGVSVAAAGPVAADVSLAVRKQYLATCESPNARKVIGGFGCER